jgi:hypothetical protein
LIVVSPASQPVELRSIVGKQTSPQVIGRLPTNQSLFEQPLLLEDDNENQILVGDNFALFVCGHDSARG